MKRLLDEGILEEDWKVLPVLSVAERRHTQTGEHRLMEHIGKGRWLERSRGPLKAMQQQADQNNKEGYHTPLKKEEVTERERFSVMERMRLVVK
jgi:hypothetical protein